MAKQTQALGKGLGALIKRPTAATPTAGVVSEDDLKRVRQVPVTSVIPSPLQPRAHFFEAPLDELMESIREHGIIQPLIVRPANGKLELIAGERRWRAAVKLQLETVPVIEREATDQGVLEMALIENIQRENLDPMEEATGYVRLSREYGLTQEEIARRVGKNRASVANLIRLLDLHPDVQMQVARKALSVGHAKVILSLKDQDAQLEAANQVIRKSLTVRAAERLVQQLLAKPDPDEEASQGASREADVHIRAVANRLRSHLATHVAIHHSPKKGRIEIEYYGNDDLQRLLELLGLPTAD